MSALPQVREDEPVQAKEQAGVTVDSAGSGGPNDSVKLRLDLNLEVELEVKAKIHGDVTLSLQ